MLRAAAIAVLGLAAPLPADGQAVARLGRASLVLPVKFTIGPRLLLVSAGPAEVVARTPAGVEIDLPFRVASNIPWIVTVGLPHTETARDQIAVRNERGAWVPLSPGAQVRVVGRRQPSEPTTIRLRVRLPSATPPGFTDRLRFSIEPAEAGPIGE